jgi:hypothetical protein
MTEMAENKALFSFLPTALKKRFAGREAGSSIGYVMK